MEVQKKVLGILPPKAAKATKPQLTAILKQVDEEMTKNLNNLQQI